MRRKAARHLFSKGFGNHADRRGVDRVVEPGPVSTGRVGTMGTPRIFLQAYDFSRRDHACKASRQSARPVAGRTSRGRSHTDTAPQSWFLQWSGFPRCTGSPGLSGPSLRESPRTTGSFGSNGTSCGKEGHVWHPSAPANACSRELHQLSRRNQLAILPRTY